MFLEPHEVYLTGNFTLEEMMDSQTADQLDIDNTPTPEHIENAKLVCEFVLEPVRAYVGKGFAPNSFYRCMTLNRIVGGSNNSQHQYGQAVDFKIIGWDTYELACWIRDNLEYDHLILENYKGGSTGWIHCSFIKKTDTKKNRQKVSTKRKGSRVYLTGLQK